MFSLKDTNYYNRTYLFDLSLFKILEIHRLSLCKKPNNDWSYF